MAPLLFQRKNASKKATPSYESPVCKTNPNVVTCGAWANCKSVGHNPQQVRLLPLAQLLLQWTRIINNDFKITIERMYAKQNAQ